jgi:hypothetical protein
MSMNKFAGAFAAALLVATGAASASSINVNFTNFNDPAAVESRTTVFTTEIKYDKTLSGGQNGHDMFVRNGESFTDNES